MGCSDRLKFRLAGPSDAEGIAILHADSWRRHYRGAYSDAFLDGDVTADRLAVWEDRLEEPDPGRCTILAEDDGIVIGFAHAVFDDDRTWGTLLDNLHVAHGHQRMGIGSRLLANTARALVGAQTTGLCVWVLEQNVHAQAFYQARGGELVGRRHISPPGDVPSRLNGSPTALQYAWPDPSVLLAQR